MPRSELLKLRMIQRCLDLFEEARRSKNSVSVSQLSHRYSSGKGVGVEKGIEFHRKIWGLDPYDILQYPQLATPMPLAYRFRSFYLYGVADIVVFSYGIPKMVLEYKSYDDIRRAEKVQASLYGLLVELLFAVKPSVFVKTPKGVVNVKNWELLALEALERVTREKDLKTKNIR